MRARWSCCPLCVTHVFVAFAVSALLAGLAAGIFPCLVSSGAGTKGAWHVFDMFLRGRSALGSHG
ncbi:unnamed protein product [Ectocarpus sp. CCAP 1310/34]|nr:unnamed protein product [Ectocarpus sp. CCAP 1310/34]